VRDHVPPALTHAQSVRFFVGVVLAACVLAFYAYKRVNAPPPTTIAGKAWVIDGDTIEIAGTRIRLEGIDAPETDQPCTDARGKPWPCGRAATNELRAHVRGRALTCNSRALDRYRRSLAVCSLPDGSDINAWMVRQGWAVAYGLARLYVSEEAEAEKAKQGMWTGSFTLPSQWRQQHQHE
jgi:endonuclease YncB( thermonuclease family)